MAFVAKNPDIRTAQLFCEKYEPVGADGVIILVMKRGWISGGVSYGATKEECNLYGQRLDSLILNDKKDREHTLGKR